MTKTPKKRLTYMRTYYQSEKYKAWQRAYRKKKYATNKVFREYCKRKVKEWQMKQKTEVKK